RSARHRPRALPGSRKLGTLFPGRSRRPEGSLPFMYSDGSALQRLSREECLTLMASVPVGRIIYTRRALPAVELVNFALDHDDIVIQTTRTGRPAADTPSVR